MMAIYISVFVIFVICISAWINDYTCSILKSSLFWDNIGLSVSNFRSDFNCLFISLSSYTSTHHKTFTLFKIYFPSHLMIFFFTIIIFSFHMQAWLLYDDIPGHIIYNKIWTLWTPRITWLTNNIIIRKLSNCSEL